MNTTHVGYIVLMVGLVLFLAEFSLKDTRTTHSWSVFRDSRTEEPTRNVSPQEHHLVCTETQHLYFLKVHKAGSTTVQNIFSRFALSHKLNVMTMFKGFKSYPRKQFSHKLPPLPAALTNGKYDVYCEHSVYDEEYLMTKLQNDTVNIAIIREPMSHLRSSFAFYRLARPLHLAHYEDPVAEFLRDPAFYSSHYRSRAHEVTHNRVAMEFGYDENIHNWDHYLTYIDCKFLVLIYERLPESLVVMKRTLCWNTKDILHAHTRKQSYKTPKVNQTLSTWHETWTPLDYAIYDYFKIKMTEVIDQQDNDFHGEVKLFEKYLDRCNAFCDHICQQMGSLVQSGAEYESRRELLDMTHVFARSPWDQGFNITGWDCLLMRYDPGIYRKAQKVRLFPEYCTKTNDTVNLLNIDSTYCHREVKQPGFPADILTHRRFVTPCY